jgi:hypothetical protein
MRDEDAAAGRACEDCLFANPSYYDSSGFFLECRRRSPPDLVGSTAAMSAEEDKAFMHGWRWPGVIHDDWCGEFKPKLERKVDRD